METIFTRSRIMSMLDMELLKLAKDDLEIPFAGMIGTTNLRNLVLGRLEEAGRIRVEEAPKPPTLSAEDLRVNQVLDCWLPLATAIAKSNSWPTVIVMSVEDECIPHTLGKVPDVSDIKLKGATKRIFDHCTKQGLRPELRRSWNGCGYDYDVVVQTPS